MDESFSPVIFVYGMAFILGVGKACTLLIWRTLAKPMPGIAAGRKGCLAAPDATDVRQRDGGASARRPRIVRHRCRNRHAQDGLPG